MTRLALLLTAFVFFAPLAGLFSRLSSQDLSEMFATRAFGRSLGHTLVIGIASALLSLGFGIFFARRFALYEWGTKRVQRLLLLIPYLIPNFILATAYVLSWNPTSGLLNGVVRFPGGLYGRTGIIVLLAIAHLPVAFLLLEDRFKRIDSSLREAALLSGASSWKILTKIELPLVMPALVGAFGLCFALAISAFAVPAWIGAPERVYPMTYKIYQSIQMNGFDGIPRAAGYSLILFVMIIPILLLGAWVQRDEGRFVLVTGKAARVSEKKPRASSQAVFQAIFWVWQLVFWIAPLAVLILSTFVKPGCLQQNGLSCLAHAGLETYRYVLFDLDETRIGLQGSVLYGTLAALLIVIVSVALVLLFSRSRWSSRIADWIFTIPISTPGAIIAIGLIVTCSGRYGINLYNTAWIAVVAFFLKHFNLAYQPVKNGLTGISNSLFEAAKLSGAKKPEIWRRILIPMLRPEITGGFFLVLIPILGELTMSVFLVSPKFRTIGTVLFDLQDYADQSSAAALSVLLILLILAANEATRFLSRGKLGY
jgi:iron(III) transport system permease protein